MMRIKRFKIVALTLVIGCGAFSLASEYSRKGRPAEINQVNGIVTHQLYLMGGGDVQPCINEFAALVGEGKLVILPHASQVPQERGEKTAAWFRKAGIKRLQVLLPDDEDGIPQDVDAIFITGGDQRRLLARLTQPLRGRVGKDCLLTQLQRHYQTGKLVGGTSAGAAAAPPIMIARWDERRLPDLQDGLGLLPGVVVDMHFDVNADRPGRLDWSVKTLHARGLSVQGIGLPEGTGVLIQMIEGRSNPQVKVTGKTAVTLVTFEGARDSSKEMHKIEVPPEGTFELLGVNKEMK